MVLGHGNNVLGAGFLEQLGPLVGVQRLGGRREEGALLGEPHADREGEPGGTPSEQTGVGLDDDEVTLDEGYVQQSNFRDYRSLRIHEMPEVEVHIVPSAEAPTGVGEPGVPPIAPAVANALAALTGRRVRRLPLRNGAGERS